MLALVACGGAPASDEAPAAQEPAGAPQTVSEPTDAVNASDPSPAGAPADEAMASAADSEWTRGRVRGGSTDRIATVRAVRTARHAGYDRLVIELEGGLPHYVVEPARQPVTACGSGEQVALGTASVLTVMLDAANAHTDAGEPTLDARAWQPDLPALAVLRLTCDFEAHVELAAGLRTDSEFRVLTLVDPIRLVVDIRHPR